MPRYTVPDAAERGRRRGGPSSTGKRCVLSAGSCPYPRRRNSCGNELGQVVTTVRAVAASSALGAGAAVVPNLTSIGSALRTRAARDACGARAIVSPKIDTDRIDMDDGRESRLGIGRARAPGIHEHRIQRRNGGERRRGSWRDCLARVDDPGKRNCRDRGQHRRRRRRNSFAEVYGNRDARPHGRGKRRRRRRCSRDAGVDKHRVLCRHGGKGRCRRPRRCLARIDRDSRGVLYHGGKRRRGRRCSRLARIYNKRLDRHAVVQRQRDAAVDIGYPVNPTLCGGWRPEVGLCRIGKDIAGMCRAGENDNPVTVAEGECLLIRAQCRRELGPFIRRFTRLGGRDPHLDRGARSTDESKPCLRTVLDQEGVDPDGAYPRVIIDRIVVCPSRRSGRARPAPWRQAR